MERNNDRNDGTSDRITELPDDILLLFLCKLMCCNVMLQTRDIVKLMIVSKRWVNLSLSLPYLRFSDENHDFPNISPFITNVLLRRDPLSAVHTFCVSWKHNVHHLREQLINAWSIYLVGHNIKILKLDLKIEERLTVDYNPYYKCIQFPDCIFRCPTLEELDLRVPGNNEGTFGGCLNFHSYVRLGRLRKLCLHSFFDNSDSFGKLVSGCPVLEELELMNCCLGFNGRISITSDTLRHLTIENGIMFGELLISCPNIRSLTFTAYFRKGLQFLYINVSSLVNAKIYIGGISSFYLEHDEEHPEFIAYGAKRGSIYSRLPIFQSLKKLELVATVELIEYNFLAVASFLESAPNLEVLVLGQYDNGICEIRDYVCPHYKLKVIINGLRSKGVFDQIDFFLGSICDCKRE